MPYKAINESNQSQRKLIKVDTKESAASFRVVENPYSAGKKRARKLLVGDVNKLAD